jgi:hypothetical protein
MNTLTRGIWNIPSRKLLEAEMRTKFAEIGHHRWITIWPCLDSPLRWEISGDSRINVNNTADLRI